MLPIAGKKSKEVAAKLAATVSRTSGSGSELIGLMNDSSTPLVSVSCSSGLGAYLFTVRVIDRRDIFADQERKANYFRFLAWSDSGPAQEFTALVAPERPDFGEVWVSTNPAINEGPQILWGTFKTSPGAMLRLVFTPRLHRHCDASPVVLFGRSGAGQSASTGSQSTSNDMLHSVPVRPT
jgi:hypothetical protein